jgi:ABC-type Na+ efflux pump permease subunit
MKALDIALKDITQALRSLFLLVFMFGVPILMTALFAFMFGGQGNDPEPEINLSTVSLLIVNLDEGDPQFDASNLVQMGVPLQPVGGGAELPKNLGEVLIPVFQGEAFSELLDVSLGEDAEAARQAVIDDQVGMAIIIPPNFTAALFQPGIRAEIELIQDPALTITPQIVATALNQTIESMVGSKIGMQVISAQITEAGQAINGGRAQQIAMAFIQATLEQSSTAGNSGIELRFPGGTGPEQVNQYTLLIRNVLAGMMIFFAFFTGGAVAQSILTEDEQGTLARLFTTPTLHSTVLSGKFLAVGLTVLVQMTILVLVGHWVFGIDWGEVLPLALATLVGAITASTFGLFIVSLLKNARQAGVVFGGLYTVTGMLGTFGAFAMGAANAQTLDRLSLLVPQGWVMRAITLTMQNKPLTEILLIIGGALIWSAVFFIVGNLRLQKRYA